MLITVLEVVPRFGSALELATEWRALESQRAEAAGAPAARQALAAENRRLRQQLNELFVSLPSRDQLSAVLGELQRHAAETGVTLERIEPGEVMPERTHEVLPLAVEIQGPFHATGRFVDRVERSPLLIQVQALSIRRQSEAPSSERVSVETTLNLESVRLGGGASQDEVGEDTDRNSSSERRNG